jgi:integrase
MAKVGKALTAKQDAALKSGFDKDGNPIALDHPVYGATGLHKQVRPSGGYCYFFRYKSPVTDKRRRYTIDDDDRKDNIKKLSLGEAREITLRVRALIPAGICPLEERKKKKAQNKHEQGKQVTFRERAEYWKRDIKAPDFKHGVDDDQYQRLHGLLENHIYPKIGDLMLADVKLDQVLSVVLPFNQTQHDLSKRLRTAIWRVLQHAINHDLIPSPNYADWDLLKEDLGKGKRKEISERRPSLAWEKVPKFFDYIWNEDWEYRPHVACLAFTILTNPRSGVATRLDWKSIDLEKKIWTIETGEGKTYAEYEIVLSDRAIEVLKSQRSFQHQTGLVFRSATKGTVISTGTVLDVAKEYGKSIGERVTTQGFRRSFTNFFAENHGTNFSYTARKLSMQQAPGTKEEVAYNSASVIAERTQMMKIWADWCVDGTKTKPSNVTSINQVKKLSRKRRKRRGLANE